MKRRLQSVRAFLLVSALSSLLGCGGTAEESPGEKFQAALQRGDLDGAERVAESVPRNDPTWREAQLLLGRKAQESGNSEKALEIYTVVPRDGSEESVEAARAAAVLQQEAGQLASAIKSLRYVISHDPDDKDSKARLIRIYAAVGQRSLADEILERLLLSEELSFKQLVLLSDFERRDPDDLGMLQSCAERCPDDPAVNLGLAVEELQKRQVASARQRLENSLRQNPSNATAQGLLGEILADGELSEFLAWYKEVPKEVVQSPEVWFALGMRARADGNMRESARCYWEAARRVPTSYRAVYNLGSVLATIDPAVASVFLKRAEDMQRLRHSISKVLNSSGHDSRASQDVVETLMNIGREWEAWNWVCLSEQRFPDQLWVRAASGRLSQYPNSNSPRQLDAMNLTKIHSLEKYPDFQSRYLSAENPESPQTAGVSGEGIRFEDEAQLLGLHFTYHQGRVDQSTGVRMFESTGGGVSVLDFDVDGVADLFFTQGEDWPRGSNSPRPTPRHFDQLFRGGLSHYSDVTVTAALSDENSFGQGCSAGDINNDGFPDLYVANIGRNQLLVNNGDGTFNDVTVESGIETSKWTSSCVIADLNSDGNPDLYDVNYVEGEGVYQADCNEHRCSTLPFKGIPDDVYFSSGDGRFRHVCQTSEGTAGPGLGVVVMWNKASLADQEAADVAEVEPSGGGKAGSGEAQISLFVGNDGQPNFLLRAGAGIEMLRNKAFLQGVAVNAEGRHTSSMGIASGDIDGNGQIDLFVTNFSGEANTLFLQQPDGFFVDGIVGTGLMEPGLPLVGWGTQFVDVDCDGRLDLVVTNGHVADFHDAAVDCLMQTQVFRQKDHLQFELLRPDSAGPFFAKRQLGRSLARLDWNNDGQMDVVLTAVGSEAALLTNRTSAAGHFLKVRPHSTSGARDGSGVSVTVETEGRFQRQQLLAGGGFQASNEHVLHFGLAESKRIHRVTIEWPNGGIQELVNLPSDLTIDVVENRNSVAVTGQQSVSCSVTTVAGKTNH